MASSEVWVGVFARLRRLRDVVAEAWPFWLALAGVAAALLLGRYFASTLEAAIRFAVLVPTILTTSIPEILATPA